MFKNFPKINTFVIAIFIFGILLGVLSGIGIGIKYLFENKISPPASETPKEETRTVTGWVKFRAYREEKIPFAPPPASATAAAWVSRIVALGVRNASF